MTILGINFTKIIVERKDVMKGKINIANNVSITDIDKVDMDLGAPKRDGLNIRFKFTSLYEPDFAQMIFEGVMVYMDDEKKVKDILKDWKKDKKMEKEFMATIINAVLNKCNIEALFMSREANLPSPIPLPKIQQQSSQ
jgi:hypothetical protein